MQFAPFPSRTRLSLAIRASGTSFMSPSLDASLFVKKICMGDRLLPEECRLVLMCCM